METAYTAHFQNQKHIETHLGLNSSELYAKIHAKGTTISIQPTNLARSISNASPLSRVDCVCFSTIFSIAEELNYFVLFAQSTDSETQTYAVPFFLGRYWNGDLLV